MDDNLISQSNQTSNNNIFPSIQELDDLNKISEQEKNSMMCRYNIRVYFVYGFQVLAIIFFIVMVSAKDDLTLYLSLMFFACFETAVITLNCVAIDEFKILSSGGTPLNQVLEKYFYHNNPRVEYYITDYCTGTKTRGVSLFLPIQTCLDISGLLTIEPDQSFFILFIKKYITFMGDPSMINNFFISLNKEFGNIQEIKKELKFGESDEFAVIIRILEPACKYYVKVGDNDSLSKYRLLGTLSNLIGLGGVFLLFLRYKISRKEFTIKKVISNEDLEIVKQSYPDSNPGYLFNNNRFIFDSPLIKNDTPQPFPTPEQFIPKTYKIIIV